MKGRSVGILLIVLMVVIVGSLFVVIRICGGARVLDRDSFENKSIALAAAVSLLTRKTDNGGHPEWRRVMPIWTFVAAAGFCLWLLV